MEPRLAGAVSAGVFTDFVEAWIRRYRRDSLGLLAIPAANGFVDSSRRVQAARIAHGWKLNRLGLDDCAAGGFLAFHDSLLSQSGWRTGFSRTAIRRAAEDVHFLSRGAIGICSRLDDLLPRKRQISIHPGFIDRGVGDGLIPGRRLRGGRALRLIETSIGIAQHHRLAFAFPVADWLAGQAALLRHIEISTQRFLLNGRIGHGRGAHFAGFDGLSLGLGQIAVQVAAKRRGVNGRPAVASLGLLGNNAFREDNLSLRAVMANNALRHRRVARFTQNFFFDLLQGHFLAVDGQATIGQDAVLSYGPLPIGNPVPADIGSVGG